MGLTMSESGKSMLIAFLMLFILIFIIAGYIGLIVERVMKRQAKRLDSLMHDVVAAKVVTNERAFRRLAIKKNNRLFFKQSLIGFLILLLAFIVYLINGAISKNWTPNLFDYKKEGVATIFFLWNFDDPSIYINFFGMRIIGAWPPILNTPHWEVTAWASYIIFPCLLIGGCWYLVATQAHIARTFRIYKLGKMIFNPKPTAPQEADSNINNTNLNV